MGPATEQLLREFVAKRIDYIRAGNRQLLDGTYDLTCRNQYNRHDYDWYMRLIESGFGAEVQAFEIAPISNDTPLPFVGLVTYPWPPQYVVSLTAANQRRTVWLLRIHDDVPKVVLPAFNGCVGDAVVSGHYGRLDTKRPVEANTVFRFDEDQFAHELAERIGLELNGVKVQLQYDEIRALAIDCFPWFGSLALSILTVREPFSEEECGKWATSEWRYQDFPSTPSELWPYARDLIKQMKAYYDSGTEGDRDLRADAIYRACAKALRSPAVSRALEFYGFKLAKDFEFGVFDPDHPEKGNYCSIVGSGATGG